MKKKLVDTVLCKYLVIAYVVFASMFVVFSCSNDTNLEQPRDDEKVKIEIPELNLSLDMEDGLISFNDETAFINAVSALKNNQSTDVTTRSYADISTDEKFTSTFSYESKFPKSKTMSKYGFISLYDDFIVAMEEAESYYDREGGYEEFKEKHSTLFFPETEDDYSAYLPTSDKDIAKLLNVNGEIIIGGEVVNMLDITSYEQLKELGIVPNDESKWITLKSMNASPITDLSETRSKETVLPEVFCNNRKLWINCSNVSGDLLLIEVCFRKKGAFCAWYNYSSTTRLRIDYSTWRYASGASSHDRYLIRSYTPTGQPLRFNAKGEVQFQGFGAECGDTIYSFSINMD
jgi:hypothetical protein